MKASTACGCSLSLGVYLVNRQDGFIDEKVGKLLDTQVKSRSVLRLFFGAVCLGNSSVYRTWCMCRVCVCVYVYVCVGACVSNTCHSNRQIRETVTQADPRLV